MQNIKKGMENSWEHFNDCVESDLGAWEYYRENGSTIYQLQYFKPDDDTPSITLNLSKKEFDDLKTLFPNIEKYKNNNMDIINAIRKATGASEFLCVEAYENTNNMDDAINYIHNNMSKLSIDSRFNKK